jgi:4,5-dihydroxyphthalate decarboxylase
VSAPLSFVFGGPYDRIADVEQVAAENGVGIETRLVASPKEAFAALRDSADLAGGEMSVSFYMTQRSRLKQGSNLVALPVWISRSFRHGNIYVREGSDIGSPHELRGRRIGLPEYGMTMAVWLRGLFADEYGVRPSDVQWVTHRAPAGLAEDAVKYPADVDIVDAPPGRSPQEQLLRGEVDAWIGAGLAPSTPGVRRLFADAHAEEREYFRRTGIFPVMHVLVLRRSLVEQDPRLADAVFDVFNKAKVRAQRRLWSTSVSYATLPWTLAAVEEQARLMGSDPWPYGLKANMATLEALLRYMDVQQLVWDRLSVTDYFLPLEPQA